MDLSNATYDFLVQAHSGLKAGYDNSHAKHDEMLAAVEGEIVKRRKASVQRLAELFDGTTVSVMEARLQRAFTTAPLPTDIDPVLRAAMIRDNISRIENGKGDRITGYKASRPSYPYSFSGARGGRWKASPEQIRARFG